MRRTFRAGDYDPDADRDLSEELDTHLELLVEDLMASGMTETEARAEAENRMAEPAEAHSKALPQAQSRQRRQSFLNRLHTLGQDVRYALRRMTRSPGFTAIAILSLAIGIGANTAVFSVVNAFLIRKAPFKAPNELVRIYSSFPRAAAYASTSYPDFQDVRAMKEVFSDVGATELLMAVADVGDSPRRVLVESLSANLLPMLGIHPILGRGFLPEEDQHPGEDAVVLLGHGFWQETFGGDPDVIGHTVTLAGLPYTVVGVMPPSFGCTVFNGINMDLFIPVSMSARAGGGSPVMDQRGNSRFELLARLAPGVTLETARARLDVLADRLREAYPDVNSDRSFRILSEKSVAISPELDQGMEMGAAFLLVVVGLVLLLACTNLATFLLARGTERRKEIAMRLALGAGRRQLIQQLLTETILLGVAGGFLGLFLAHLTLSVVVAYQPPIPVSLNVDLGLDRTVFLFTLGISTLAGIVFGLLPALQSTKPDVAGTLKGGSRGTPRGQLRLQTGLVAIQMMVSMILLVGGGVFLRSLMAAQNVDPGFSTAEAGIAWLDLSASRIPREERENVRLDLEERILSEPGIESVAFASHLPLSLGNSFQSFRIPGVDPPQGQSGYRIDEVRVGPGYFRVMDIPVLAGRSFRSEDREGAPRVILVNDEMARRFWPGESPVGKEVFAGSGDRSWTVVGVAANTKIQTLGEPPRPLVYFPIAQFPANDLQILARGALPTGEIVSTLRRVVREANPGLVVMEIKTMREHLAVRLFGYRSAATLLGIFGVLALLLSSLGLYGVVSFSISRRVREMGIRLSLGAAGGQVTRMVVGQALRVVAVGGALGLLLAVLLVHLVRAFLLGVSPSDPQTLLGIPLLLGIVALLAAYVPARRASRVNPVEALRSE